MGKGGEVGESLRRCIKILNRTSQGGRSTEGYFDTKLMIPK
jgi:hypothetical protein